MTDDKDGQTVGRSDGRADGQTDGRSDGQEAELPEALLQMARVYHEPTAVPRDAIWARIQSARLDSPTIRPSDRLTVPQTVRPSARLPVWLGIAALLAVGIGIGRWSLGGNAAPTTAPASVAADAPRRNAALSLTAANHLGRAEAFLTAVRVGDRGEGFENQARDLLLTTRFLLDARGITDPRTRALLQDLELVLVQIAQLGGRDGEEVDLLYDALEQKEVLPRLRKDL